MRGDDAEDTQLPDVFMMTSKLGDSRMGAPDVPVLIYTANASKTNNEDRVEVGGAIRHKDNPMKCAQFNLGYYFRVRFVDQMLFCWTRFIPKVLARVLCSLQLAHPQRKLICRGLLSVARFPRY